MAPGKRPAHLPVLLLHNLDPTWGLDDAGSVREAVGHLMTALRSEGHRVIEAPVASADLDAALAGADPAGRIVFNWCEELPGCPHSDVHVARVLEERGSPIRDPRRKFCP
jgi:hypothetical protein